MNTPTPRTDAAWNATFDSEQMSAGRTARALRECSQQLETELNALAAECDQLRAERDSIKQEIEMVEHRAYRAEVERDQLRAALALGQINCDAEYDDLRNERDAALARAERAEAELAAERARLDWLESPAGFDWQWNSAHSVIVRRSVIDAAMKEGAK